MCHDKTKWLCLSLKIPSFLSIMVICDLLLPFIKLDIDMILQWTRISTRDATLSYVLFLMVSILTVFFIAIFLKCRYYMCFCLRHVLKGKLQPADVLLTRQSQLPCWPTATPTFLSATNHLPSNNWLVLSFATNYPIHYSPLHTLRHNAFLCLSNR